MDAMVPDSGQAQEQDLEQVLRRLSHEIRNPLASLKAGIQLLQRLTHPQGEIAEYFSSLLTQVGRIDRIVDGVHGLARLEAGEVRPVAVAEAVARAVQAAQVGATRAGVALHTDAGPWCEVLIDRDNLQLALQELIGNAVQASPAGATVSVSWEIGPSGRVRINVDDEGAGVASENADKILRPFFSTQPQGRGLGLTLVRRVCHLAGGRLDWEALGQGGCRFAVWLPARAQTG